MKTISPHPQVFVEFYNLMTTLVDAFGYIPQDCYVLLHVASGSAKPVAVMAYSRCPSTMTCLQVFFAKAAGAKAAAIAKIAKDLMLAELIKCWSCLKIELWVLADNVASSGVLALYFIEPIINPITHKSIYGTIYSSQSPI